MTTPSMQDVLHAVTILIVKYGAEYSKTPDSPKKFVVEFPQEELKTLVGIIRGAEGVSETAGVTLDSTMRNGTLELSIELGE